jgi:uncharacterized membrane protein
MNAAGRIVVTSLVALAFWISGAGISAAHPMSSGSVTLTAAAADTKTSVLTAGAAGLALGGVIAFWQSRKQRRKNTVFDEVPPADPPKPGDESAPR